MQEGFLEERIPLVNLGRINRSQSNEVPRVQGEKRMASEAKAHAALKVKERDVFVELEVDRCGSSFWEVRKGRGKRLDYRECWWPETIGSYLRTSSEAVSAE